MHLRSSKSIKAHAVLNKILVLLDIRHPYDKLIVDGILEALQNSNEHYKVTFMTYDEAMLVAHDSQWDAVIADFAHRQNIEMCSSLNAPTIALLSYRYHVPTLDLPKQINICLDSLHICEMAKDHLMECDIKRLGYFAGMANNIGPWAEERKVICKQLAEEANIEWVGGYNTYNIREFLQNHLQPETGFMCASDTQARQLITLAHNLNIEVPGQLVVIGVDNNQTENQMSLVPISSVEFIPGDIGRTAVAALLELDQATTLVTKYISPVKVYSRLSTRTHVSEDPLVTTALKFIHKNFHRPIRVEQVIEECQSSRATLENRFKKVLDKTIHQILHEVRLESAKDMLANTQKSIDDISVQCGLANPQYLYYLFRKEVGMTPSKYREIKGNI